MPPQQPNHSARNSDEERPLLSTSSSTYSATNHQQNDHEIQFGEKDSKDPHSWSKYQKLSQVGIVALMALLPPLASSMFTPGISQIAEDLNTTEQAIIGTTTGYLVMLGVGPLVLAPFSETFGRRNVYMVCFTAFSLLQIPTALSPNVGCLIAVRTVSGFFGSKFGPSLML